MVKGEKEPIMHESPRRLPKEKLLAYDRQAEALAARLREAGVEPRASDGTFIIDFPEGAEVGDETLRMLQLIGKEIEEGEEVPFEPDEITSIMVSARPSGINLVALRTDKLFLIALHVPRGEPGFRPAVPTEFRAPLGVIVSTLEEFRNHMARRLDEGISNVEQRGVQMRQENLARDIMELAEKAVEQAVEKATAA